MQWPDIDLGMLHAEARSRRLRLVSETPQLPVFQIPAQKLYNVMASGMSSVGAVKELPPVQRVVGATLLIAGGTVGAGIIALPVKTAVAGFIPSMTAMAGECAIQYLRNPSAAFVATLSETLIPSTDSLHWNPFPTLLCSMLGLHDHDCNTPPGAEPLVSLHSSFPFLSFQWLFVGC